MNMVSQFHYLLSFIIGCNELLFLVILNSLFTDSLHFPSVFIHGLIQLFFNVQNRIKIITKVRLGLILGQVFPIIVECFSGIGKCIIARIQRRIQNPVNTHIYTSGIYSFCLYCLGSVCDRRCLKTFTEDLNEYRSLKTLVYC